MVARVKASALAARSIPEVTRATALPSGRVQLAIGAISGCILFMISYGVLHGMHVAGYDPALLERLSAIPLFATALASGLIAAPAGVLASVSLGARIDLLRRLPLALAVAAVALAGEIIFFP
jgi:hypothetical protein